MKTKKARIAVVVCYMGRLPWYFDYFIRSCEYNSTIDFILILDSVENTRRFAPNIKIVPKKISEINDLAIRKLGISVKITNGYKLCDFKPTYGILFADLLEDYDFWAHADIDVIFGNIRKFINDGILKNYDLISVRHDFLTGQFLVFRNDEKMNRLFTLSKDCDKVLSSEEHFCFDETNFCWQEFNAGKGFNEIHSEVESMTHLVKRLEHDKYLRVHFDFLIVEGTPGKLTWSRGKLFYRRRYEILLYHLVHFKKVCCRPRFTERISDVFSISPTRIYNN